jgi:hypothetical protein
MADVGLGHVAALLRGCCQGQGFDELQLAIVNHSFFHCGQILFQLR